MSPYLAEAVGTLILIIFGDGVVANVLLQKSKGKDSGWIVITTGWAIGVMMAVYCVGRISGAHLNPAVTISLAVLGSFPWGEVPGYIVSQVIGAFLGGIVVWLAYLPHWGITESAESKLAIFCTIPAIRKLSANFLTEVIGTAVLIFGILGIGANALKITTPGDLNLALVYRHGLQPMLVGFLVWGLGLSLGGPTGYAINPARDLGPRIMHAILPIPGKGGSDWGYSWIPVVGPLIGAAIAAVVYGVLPH